MSIDILGDIKEQHIFVEYLINKCYPCIDYSMASHHLSAFRNLTTAWGWSIQKTTHPEKVANTIQDKITREDYQVLEY